MRPCRGLFQNKRLLGRTAEGTAALLAERGRLVDGLGSSLYSYTTAGRLSSEDGPWERDTVSYSYSNRLRSGVTVQAPNAPDRAQRCTDDLNGNLLSGGGRGFEYDDENQ